MRMRRFWRLLLDVLLAAFLAVIAGCSRGTRAPAQSLFVTVPEAAEIAIYPVSAMGAQRPSAVIRESPPDRPVDVSIDGAGKVFVANENGNVRAYASHDNQFLLVRTVAGPHTKISHPVGLAVDLAGSFYLADRGSEDNKGRVEWFAGGLNGNIEPGRVISGPHTGITTPGGIAMDASGRVFVTEEASNKVLVFDANAERDATPIATIAGLQSPRRVFVDSVLNVYVTDKTGGISVFTASGPESWAFSTRISSRALHDPNGISADAIGRVAVGQRGGILFFAPNAHENAEPIAELRGPMAMNPAGICIH